MAIIAVWPRPSSWIAVSRILNFWTLPVTVIGKPSTNFTYRGILKCAILPRQNCDLAAAELPDVLLGQRSAGSRDHPRHQLFAVALVGNADHLHVGDAGWA